MTTTTPLKITRSDPSRITIEWDDGHETTYSAAQLRRLCPCARCVDERTGKRTLQPESIPDDMTQVALQLVGNYAISVRFEDGHDTGIFPFGMLREHDPAAS